MPSGMYVIGLLCTPQKLEERKSLFKKSNMPDKEKEKWLKIFVPDMVSSEESDSNDGDIIIVKPLGWRSERINQMFKKIDDQIESRKTTQARRQKRKRVLGSNFSSRKQPSHLPKWAVTE